MLLINVRKFARQTKVSTSQSKDIYFEDPSSSFIRPIANWTGVHLFSYPLTIVSRGIYAEGLNVSGMRKCQRKRLIN